MTCDDFKELIDAMAESAHNAWWEYYKKSGYTSRKAAWGEEFMVPFDQLSERGKELDRIIMYSIFVTFDRVGLKVVKK